jgi:ABC-type nitrate/sulfonate/bicarbonate transport system permease component
MSDLGAMRSNTSHPAKPGRGGIVAMARRMPRLVGIVLIIGVLLLWEASARFGWIASANWPPASLVFVALGKGIASGELVTLLVSTLGRALAGYALGCSSGVLAGILLGTSRWARYILRPWIEVLRPIPAPAIVPALIMFLGVDNALKVFVVGSACFMPVFLNTLAGVAEVDDVLLQTARTFRISPWRRLTQVILPAALPMIAAGMRVAIGLSLVVTVIAEMIAGAAGFGYYIVQMQYALRPEEMYAAVICLAATGYMFNRIFLALEARLIPWLGK